MVVDLAPSRLEAAARLGADGHVLAGDEPERFVADVTDGWGADVAIEAVGIPATLCTHMVRPGGHVANVVYIFAHAVPEIVPFLLFALSAGTIPLPLTVLQILAIDLGTETLPALALGREPAEPGLMTRPPRRIGQSVVTRDMLWRAWGSLGLVSAVLVMGAFFSLWRAGWHPGDPTGEGTALHHAYLIATTATFAGIVMCQVGTALAARTDRASLRRVGFFSNPLLLVGIAFELLFTAVLVWVPPFQGVFGTAPWPGEVIGIIAVFPLIVWGSDELRRHAIRHRSAHPSRAVQERP